MGKYHDILGVQPGATEDELKKAFRKLAKQFHPDQNADNPEAEAKFKEINEAYNGLKDGRTGPDINEDARNYAKNHFGFDPMDLVRELAKNGRVFSQMNEGMADSKMTVGVKMKIPVRKFLQGGETTLEYNVPDFSRAGGWNYKHHTKKFTIQPGTLVGHRVTFPGEGPLNARGEAGDLIIDLFADSDGPYEIHDGVDIVANVIIDPFDVMLGVTKKVQHPDGTKIITVEFPPGGMPNQVYPCLGDGLLAINGQRGDFLVQAHVQMPVLNRKQAEILRRARDQMLAIDGQPDEAGPNSTSASTDDDDLV